MLSGPGPSRGQPLACRWSIAGTLIIERLGGGQIVQAAEMICTVSHHEQVEVPCGSVGETPTNVKLVLSRTVVLVQLECLTTARTFEVSSGGHKKNISSCGRVSLQEPGMTHLSPGGRSVGTIGAMDRCEQGVSRWRDSRRIGSEQVARLGTGFSAGPGPKLGAWQPSSECL